MPPRRILFTAVTLLAAVPAAARSSLPELWLGRIQLCRETVERTEVRADKLSGQRALIILFRPALHALLERETRRAVGGTLPIRMGRRILSEPLISEPIVGGSLALNGAGENFTKLQLAAAGECRGPVVAP